MNNYQFTGLGFLDPMHGVAFAPLVAIIPALASAGGAAAAGTAVAAGAAGAAGASTIGTIANIAMVAGTLAGAAGAVQQGKAAQANAEYTAGQLEASGKAERAKAQREAINERRKKDHVMSRARAVSAASGGGLDLELLGDLEEEGTYRSLVALWDGEERAKGRAGQAAAARASGNSARKAGYLNAGGIALSGASRFLDTLPTKKKKATTILSEGSSLYEKYG